jgi:hypothetical protein
MRNSSPAIQRMKDFYPEYTTTTKLNSQRMNNPINKWTNEIDSFQIKKYK